MPQRFDLADYGWDAGWQEAFSPLAARGLSPGRVVLEHTHIYRLAAATGEVVAHVSGRFRHTATTREDFPAVGDWVGYRLNEIGGRAQVHAVLARRSRFLRKVAGAVTEAQVVAANIDTIFVVMGCDDDFNLKRLDRYLVLAWESGASPVVLLNKADVATEPGADEKKIQAERQAPGVPMYLTSAKSGLGFEQVSAHLTPGRTIALLGSSGVGKSSIINRLLGSDRLRTGEMRASGGRGRHTTRHRELVRLPAGAMLIDTPGMRELQLWDAGPGVAGVFDDVEALAPGCRFRDCEHRSEPGCAVRAAVESGELPAKRLESYIKLQDERRGFEARHEERAQLEAKRRGKILAKAQRQHMQQFKRKGD